VKRLLLVNGGFPLPAHGGASMRSWNFVQALKDHFELSLIYHNRRGRDPEAEYMHHARQYLSDIWSVPIPPRSGPRPDTLTHRVSQKWQMIPWEIGNSYEPRFAEALNRVLADNRFDFILARHIYQAHYLFACADRIKSRIVVDLDDIEPRRIGRDLQASGSRLVDRWRTAANHWILEGYHRRRLPLVDTCIVCSEDDRHYVLDQRWNSRVEVVPNAIDFTRFTGNDIPAGSKTLLFCGTLSYEPNADAIVWFVRHVLPHLQKLHRDVRVTVIGHNPPSQVTALASEPSVHVHPGVPDVRPYYEQAAMVIVPIHSGGGTRMKILEAGACRRPVVSTTIGAEGLDLTPGLHCLIADDPIDFAKKCSQLLTDSVLAGRLADELYRFARSRYDTAVVFEKIRRVFDRTDDPLAVAVAGIQHDAGERNRHGR
jgi:glycosyltransferase involved in cell wall biosynthesis